MGKCICIAVEQISEDPHMSLLENAYEDFTIINKAVVDDGYGGTTTVWTDGATIKGAMVFDNSTQMKVAQAMGVTSAYTFTVKKNVELDYHTVVRRESDKKIFRLTSNSDDKKTPEEAALDMRQYTAEEWKI
jgi:hypothetical protein